MLNKHTYCSVSVNCWIFWYCQWVKGRLWTKKRSLFAFTRTITRSIAFCFICSVKKKRFSYRCILANILSRYKYICDWHISGQYWANISANQYTGLALVTSISLGIKTLLSLQNVVTHPQHFINASHLVIMSVNWLMVPK